VSPSIIIAVSHLLAVGNGSECGGVRTVLRMPFDAKRTRERIRRFWAFQALKHALRACYFAGAGPVHNGDDRFVCDDSCVCTFHQAHGEPECHWDKRPQV
jgi:hypothetical protein